MYKLFIFYILIKVYNLLIEEIKVTYHPEMEKP